MLPESDYPIESAFESVGYTAEACLVRLGAYRAGTDPEVDQALRLAPRIEAMLMQGKDERGTVEDAFAALAVALEEVDAG